MSAVAIIVRAASKSVVADEAGFAYKHLSALVDVLHRLDISRKVVSLTPIGNMYGRVPGDREELREAWHMAGQEVLDRAVAQARRGGCEPEPCLALLSRRIAREIVRYARERGVGLIVLATHGHTGLSHAILGGIAEAVVRLTPCLALTVPAGRSSGASAAVERIALAPDHCIVCAGKTDDLVCETCRTRVRTEALERRIAAERLRRRGSPI